MQFEDTYLQSIYKLQAPRSTFVFYVARLSGHTFVFFLSESKCLSGFTMIYYVSLQVAPYCCEIW